MEVDWAFEQSDHTSVTVGMYLKEEIKMGPGLTREKKLSVKPYFPNHMFSKHHLPVYSHVIIQI